MNKILEIDEAIEVTNKLRQQNKTIVVVGGFFDILHPGHLKFLEESKKCANVLFVLLEEDSKATQEKGERRPVNLQENRAKILSTLQNVDYVIMLKNMTSNEVYDKLMIKIQPNIIATTYGDPYVGHKERQARLVQAKVVYVTRRISDHSTTKYIGLIEKNK